MMGNAMRGMMQAGQNFIDGDEDGVCDNFVDEDGDGVCDNCQGAGGAHHGMKNQSMGGRRGMMGQGMGQNMTQGQQQGQQQSPQRGMGRGWNR